MSKELLYKIPVWKSLLRKGFCSKWMLNKKDPGMSLAPWVLLYFFIAILVLMLFFQHNLHISTKYLVEDGLAASALAGEVVDLDIYSGQQELIVTDLDYSKAVFEESLRTALRLDHSGYPIGDSAYFAETVPVQIEQLDLYNVSSGFVYKTDLLKEAGQLQYETDGGLASDSRCEKQGTLLDEAGDYQYGITMLDGEEKLIKNTSLYARIRFGVPGYGGSVLMLEKDILTDIQMNE